MRDGTCFVAPVGRATFISAECRSSSSRVPRFVFDPRLSGFSPKEWPYVLDGSSANLMGRESILVQESRFVAGKWAPVSSWHIVERFCFDPAKSKPATNFIEFQRRHYGDLRKADPHLGTLGGAGLRAWNGTTIAEYSPSSGGHCSKSVSRFRLESVARAFKSLFRASTEGYELLSSTQAGIGPIPDAPYFYAWSHNLGNAMHLDTDLFQSFATFMLGKGRTFCAGKKFLLDGETNSWWLLFPLNGVAVKLGDGVGVTWPGYAIPHCSSVPLHTRDCLSMFTSQSQSLEEAFVFQHECKRRATEQDLSITFTAPFPGARVAVLVDNKWARSVTGKWWERHDVVTVGPHGGVLVKKRGSQATAEWIEPKFVVDSPW